MRRLSEKAAKKFEARQVARIQKWRARRPGWIARTVGFLTMPIVILLRTVIPHAAVEKTLYGNIKVARRWARERRTLRDLGVASLADLTAIDLRRADRVTRKIQSRAVWMAAGIGVGSGMFGIFAMPIGMAAALNVALRTIHRVGLCYGYAEPTEAEHLFIFYALSLAGNRTPEEKAASLDAMRTLQARIAAGTAEDEPAAGPVDPHIRHHALSTAHHDLSREITKQLVQVRLLTAIPGIGAIMGLIVDTSYMRSVGRAARHAYQVRWLRDRGRWVDETGLPAMAGSPS